MKGQNMTCKKNDHYERENVPNNELIQTDK